MPSGPRKEHSQHPHHPPRHAARPPAHATPPSREPLNFSFSSLTPIDAPPWLCERAEAMGVSFDDGDIRALGNYLAALTSANEQVNLTAITDASQAWERHVLDSLSLIAILADLPSGAKVLDVGSGGGLPGIPLAICMPDLSFSLLEATGKKVEFLRAVVQWLGLKNVRVVAGRAERVAHDRGERGPAGAARSGGHREQYDAVIARAVGRTAMLAEITVPFAKVGGMVLLMKGAKAEEELAEAKESLHLLKAQHTQSIALPTSTVVVLEKSSATPRTFPRADGEPARAPLGLKKSREQQGD